MPSPPTLFLVADASRAVLWRRRVGESGYAEVRAFDNPEARLSDRELGADRPGRVFESSTGRSSAVELGTGLHDAVRRAFATDLAMALEREAAQGERFAIVAPARFLGVLREALPRPFAARLAAQLDADLTKLPKAELFDRLDRLAREAGRPAA
jgi:protein required for attachment to host cells